MYKQIKNNMTGQIIDNVQRESDKAVIPANPDNADYQRYLKWVAEGNTPTPADE